MIQRMQKLGEVFCAGTIKDQYSDKLEKSCTKVIVRSSGDLVNEGAIEHIDTEDIDMESIENEDSDNGNCGNN